MVRSPRAGAALVATLFLAGLLAGAGPGPDAGAASPTRAAADSPWVGFRIPETKLASSGWIGARTTKGGAKVYRVDPRRTRVTGRYAQRRWAERFMASSGERVSRRNTACAGLILGKYGSRRERLQAAGVDVAIYHLLYGGGFRYDRAAQIRRTDQRENGPLIRAYAQNLVENYCALRGPYSVTLTPDVDRADVGDTITYTARVVSRGAVPMENIPITMSHGSATRELVTGPEGLVTFTWTARRSGPLEIETVTHKLPYAKVRYLVPRRRGASRVVLAGLKQSDGYPRSVVVPVMGQPTLELDPDRGPRHGEPFRLRFRLAHNHAVPRTAVVHLYGPFRSETNADCTPGRLARESTVEVSATDWYAGRPVTVGAAGWYVWRVRIPGDANYNKPVARCGRPFEVD